MSLALTLLSFSVLLCLLLFNDAPWKNVHSQKICDTVFFFCVFGLASFPLCPKIQYNTNNQQNPKIQTVTRQREDGTINGTNGTKISQI